MSRIVSQEIRKFVNENLNSKFFKQNTLKSISAYSILNTTLYFDTMNEKIYEQLTKEQQSVVDGQCKMVDEEPYTYKLYGMLRKPFSPVVANKIIDRLIKYQDNIIPRLLQDLKKSGNDIFVERAAKLLIKAEENYSDGIVRILPEIKYPYTQSVMCFILGKIGTEEQIPVLYDYFRMFKKNYENDAYYEGALFALYNMKERFEF